MAKKPHYRKIGAGTGQAAVRQGFGELAAALKPFPESIQVNEPGTLFNPTQGEIAEKNRGTVWGRVEQAKEKAKEKEQKQEPTKESKEQLEKSMDRE